MGWILYIIITLNGVQQTVEIQPMGSFCINVAARLHEKTLKVDGKEVEVVSAFCVKTN